MAVLEEMAHAPTRVLVLASRDLAAKITSAFHAIPHVECTTLYDDTCDDECEYSSLQDLTGVIFPLRHSVTPPFRSFFQWGYYDFVIVQDLWLSGTEGPSLEAAGYVLASLDFMRGNFGTKKIVLLSDASFAWWKAVRHRLEPDGSSLNEEDASQLLTHRFDTKGALAFVHLTETAKSLYTLRHLIQGGHSERRRQNGKVLDDVSRLSQPVLDSTDEALRRYIGAQAEIILVEDDPEDLKRSLNALGSSGRSPGSPNRVTVASVTGENHPSEDTFDTFDSVLAACRSMIDRSLKNPGCHNVILVVDVLLNVPGLWKRTGIDLLFELRRAYEGEHRLGLVAFTGFSTPPITMAAYQLGADFVVHKGGGSGHGSSGENGRRSHEPIVTEALSRLVMTLALMCFQKEFLRGLRTSVTKGTTTPGDAHRFLNTVVPKHAISLHMRSEWEDTHYLVRCAQVYGRDTPQFRVALREVTEKYGNSTESGAGGWPEAGAKPGVEEKPKAKARPEVTV